MTINHTISAILRGRWLIDKTFADSQKPLVMQLLNGDAVTFEGRKAEENILPKLISHVGHQCGPMLYEASPGNDISVMEDGSMSMVSLSGPLMKRGGMCSHGMVDHAQLITELGNSPNVSGIILNIDSPGGQADGTALLASAIKDAATKKPVIAIIDDGMAASAAMWIASAADEIYVTQPTDQVGSIGVYTTVADWQGHYRDHLKLNVTDVYAPQSTDKNKDYRDAVAGDTSGLEADLAVLAEQFINTVATNRAGKIKGNSWKAGGMFYAEEAKKIGLIDGIKSFNEVVARMGKSINKKKSISKTSNMAFEKTLAAAQADQFAVTDEGFVLSEEQLNILEGHIEQLGVDATASAEMVQRVAVLEGELAASKTEMLDYASAILAKDDRIKALEAELAVMGKQASGDGTGLVVTEDAAADTKPLPSYLNPNSPINQMADRRTARQKKN